jgi:hypothetical protein
MIRAVNELRRLYFLPKNTRTLNFQHHSMIPQTSIPAIQATYIQETNTVNRHIGTAIGAVFTIISKSASWVLHLLAIGTATAAIWKIVDIHGFLLSAF